MRHLPGFRWPASPSPPPSSCGAALEATAGLDDTARVEVRAAVLDQLLSDTGKDNPDDDKMEPS